ncbi:lens fiber major intrinsic protein-like [Spodoptera litura]|uniref:Lens fiber major intrinsic protein-like n=1 Tax=Spodoptera litura TaxID=69820 RepID=A0A9J7IMC6_SPOLT|nr:lens fiber major intrinsic protein-like [Spodoptera litura]
MPRDESSDGAAAWLRRWWRALVAELVATALLVWLGVAAMMPVRGPGSVMLAHPAMAFGFVVIANACAFGPASGAHMNPAVTLAAVLYGQLGASPALGYVVAQMLGAVLGFGALLGTTPAEAAHAPTGCTLPAPNVSALSAALLEAALTGVLALACCGLWSAHDPARPDPAVPIKLGLVVAGLVYAGGHATGASINPARSFAPALLHGHWEYQWVYWAGPLGGAALAALAHRWVLAPRPRARADPAELPLQDKPDQP